MASKDNIFESDTPMENLSATINGNYLISGVDFSEQVSNSALTITTNNSYSNNSLNDTITMRRYSEYDEKEEKLLADTQRLKLVEMHQVGGTKLLKLVRFADLLNVREVKVKDPSGQFVTAVQFESKEESGTFTIACNLAAFARLFGLDYEPFSVAVMESAIRGD